MDKLGLIDTGDGLDMDGFCTLINQEYSRIIKETQPEIWGNGKDFPFPAFAYQLDLVLKHHKIGYII